MRKLFLLISFLAIASKPHTARGVKIGYIDMEFILEKVPDYAEAINQLEQKAQKWKQEIETKNAAITVLKNELKTERVLLTKELIEEREEEIAYLEKELLEYQEKRFGPKGDLIIQKTVLVKPIQDQIFTIVQDVAEQRKYDFIFDRSSDLTMLFADRKYDISEYVVRKLTTAQKREEMSKKQLKVLEDKEAQEDAVANNPALEERQKKLEERKAAREKLLEDRQKAIDERKAEAAEKRAKVIKDRDAKINGTVIEKDTTEGDNKNIVADDKKQTAAEIRQKAIDDRNQKLADRKKLIDEKKQKIADDRAAAIKAKEKKKEKKE